MIELDDPDDPRLSDFFSLTDAAYRSEVEASQRLFIVEGMLAIEALLRSSYAVRSILTTRRRYPRLASLVGELDAPIYVVGDDVMRATVGFDLHRGTVASAERPHELDAQDLMRLGNRMLVLEGVNDHENIGALFRNAAAFGVDAVLLDPTCADPLYRRSVRVSLGHVLKVPFARLPEWPHAIEQLHDAGWVTIALTPSGDIDIDDLAVDDLAVDDLAVDDLAVDDLAVVAPRRVALLLGAEGPGLSASALHAARHRARIPLAAGVDSLNVATAAAIALHVLHG